MVKFDLNLNLKIFNLPNKKFKPIPNFQMKSLFLNMTLSKFKCNLILTFEVVLGVFQSQKLIPH